MSSHTRKKDESDNQIQLSNLTTTPDEQIAMSYQKMKLINYNLGVSLQITYEIKKIDSDCFEEE